MSFLSVAALLALCAAAFAQSSPEPPLFPRMLLDEADVSPPPPGEWASRMPRNYQHRALPSHSVRALYVVPSNRTMMPDAIARFRQTLELSRDWYTDQMERNGFGARTFNYETEADGVTPKINICYAPNTDDYYRVEPWGRVTAAAQGAGYPIWSPGQVWWVIYEAHTMNSDGTVTGGFNGGASYGSGSDPGLGMTVAWTMAYLTPELLVDNRPYNGLIIPEVGPYPLVYDVTHVWFDGSSLSALSSVAHGIVLHEGAHGFNLSHDSRNDSSFAGNLMYNGFRGMRGWAHPDAYPNDDTRLAYASALALSASRYFNSNTSWTDNTVPTAALAATGSVAVQNGLLPVRFTATDAGGLACALLRVDGLTVDETTLTGTSADYTFRTPWYRPDTAHTVTVTVLDQQGSKRDVSGTITPTAAGNRAPQPFVRAVPSKVLPDETVMLNAGSSSDPDHAIGLLTVEWDLNGDGVFDTAPTTDKTLLTSYATAGCRQIRARLTDPAGAQSVSTPIGLRVDGIVTAVADWSLYE